MSILSRIQSELKAPKNQRNNFGKYNYRSCEDILEALKPILAKHEAHVVVIDSLESVANRLFIKATASLYHDKEIVGQSCAYAELDTEKKGMDKAQLTGSTSSYARKYALNGLFAIDDSKDSDSTNDHGNGSNRQREMSKPKKDVPGWAIAMYEKGYTREQLKALANMYSADELPLACNELLKKGFTGNKPFPSNNANIDKDWAIFYELHGQG